MIAIKRDSPQNIDIYELCTKNDIFKIFLEKPRFSRFSQIWKKTFFKVISKKRPFSENVDIIYVDDIGQKTTFSKWSQNNLIFLEMLTLLVMWSKNCFFKEISRKSLEFWYWYFQIDLEKNVWTKNDLFKIFFKKTWFFLIFGDMGKNDFLKWYQKNVLFSENVEQIFQSDLKIT